MPTRSQLANAIRFLSIDAVQKAKSGHPGMPMGMADIAEVLWNDFLKHNPKNPRWFNRDRFVLSNGHGSMLLYSLLHLTGYALDLNAIKNFRQLHSITPGHPEYGLTPGVDVTTGPLGQGFACAVGMALAQNILANEFNTAEFKIIDHYTYCFVGDGCLMEGISHEAASFAGTLGVRKLIVFWDDNGISIDGEVANWCQDDTPNRFRAYGWHVISAVDGHNPETISAAIKEARECDKPCLICCKTTIGYGAINIAGSARAHGNPLGADEISLTRKNLDWEPDPFVIPDEIYAAMDATAKGTRYETEWKHTLQAYKTKHPKLAAELERRIQGVIPELESQFSTFLEHIQNEKPFIATRKASQKVLDMLAPKLPELLGGSADLSESNLTLHKYITAILPNKLQGNYIYYGVREFGMSAIMNGIALHGGFIPYAGTFLAFIDYARNALRLSALMQQRVIYVLSHDSIGLGEDGPTHQPIEHLTMLRVTPNVSLWRPCDAAETVVAWEAAINNINGPTCLALSRQKLPTIKRSVTTLQNIKKGGYIIYDADVTEAIIIATGSEVELALNAAKELETKGIGIRVVSMPSVDMFLTNTAEYIQEVLPDEITARVAVEAGASQFWHSLVGAKGRVVGLDAYGLSAPAKDVYIAMGLTADAVIDAVMQAIHSKGTSYGY